MEEKIWSFMLRSLETGTPFAVLVVLESLGSSPGRSGFSMVVTENALCGSIGGGMMEHKMVELTRDNIKKSQTQIWIKRQVHSKESPENQSGMICSGEQTLACFPQNFWSVEKVKSILHAFENREPLYLIFSQNGIEIKKENHHQTGYRKAQDSEDWHFIQVLAMKPTIHIVGAGHVGLAFSKMMDFLGFNVVIYDDRPGLNTLEYNTFASEKKVVDYQNIGPLIPEGPEEWVAIMTFGYRTDGEVIRQLLGKSFAYLGLLGSKAKIAHMMLELEEEGYLKTDLDRVYTPIGLPIKSQTPEEIAVSIAAQIIQIRNSNK